MVKMIWAKTRAFANFGAAATNVRWGWSARSEDGKTIVVSVWDDEFDADGPSSILDRYGHRNLTKWKDKPGNHDRIKNLIWARDNCDGHFRMVVVTGKDVNAYPRPARGFRPHPRVMRLTELNESTGEFSAVSA
jgi:hypothetical protein